MLDLENESDRSFIERMDTQDFQAILFRVEPTLADIPTTTHTNTHEHKHDNPRSIHVVVIDQNENKINQMKRNKESIPLKQERIFGSDEFIYYLIQVIILPKNFNEAETTPPTPITINHKGILD
ncbi:hypothetical protein BpHYR1_037523 [Brachionus plicatilis]|uniref:Uncharacterized protein n=1 Tax=Brachionus plicatilis TaxID=10195 RepID=A0A3M7S031_BRAPC|nr:hypothetical protein BpHYR1_037523 [Brachionus plicatilis]